MDTDLTSTIQQLYGITKRLEEKYKGRHFTPDGHLVGSLGEVYAAERYDLTLFEASHPVHDAYDADGRLVQIKATQRERGALSGRPDFLIVLLISADGTFDEIYNGPGKPTWSTRTPDARQYQVSLSRLRKLNAQVDPHERIGVTR